MSEDPVVAALRAALAASAAPALRVALAERLLALGRAPEATELYAELLGDAPTHLEWLAAGASAAEAAGDPRALGWRAVLAALQAPPPPVRHAPLPAGDAPTPVLAAQQAPTLRLVRPDDPAAEPDRVTFAQVGGLEDVKRRLELSFLAPLRQPELYRAYGRTVKGGVLLYGPPGCGKTHIARATAGEVGARFMSIGLTDVLDMWIGESEKHLRDLFDDARRKAPCVVFLDELDAIGQKRSQMRHGAARTMVNQLLVELDGLEKNEGVYVIGATNHPWDIDPALKRPGRFDRLVLVTPPDAPAREHILAQGLQGRPTEGLDLPRLAALTEGWSGADLVHLVDSATEGALEEALQTGALRPVRMADFQAVLRELKPSIGPWVETARSYARYANEGGAYDDLASWLQGRR